MLAFIADKLAGTKLWHAVATYIALIALYILLPNTWEWALRPLDELIIFCLAGNFALTMIVLIEDWE